MRLYPKKLRSINDLEQEKKRLLKESRQLEKEDFLSLENLLGKGGSKGKKNEDGGGSLLDLLPFSNPLASQLIKFVVSRMPAKGNSIPEGHKEKKQGKHVFVKIATEIIGGYLKWKAIELSYKGIKHLIKIRREKKEQT